MPDTSQKQPINHADSHPGDLHTSLWPFRRSVKRLALLATATLLAAGLLSGCGFGRSSATRTPVPTWTPTPIGVQPAQPAQVDAPPTPALQAAVILTTPIPTDTPTPVPPTATPTETPVPTDTPTPEPTATPTETPEPTPTPTPSFLFDLEAAEKFPTDGLAENVVRIFTYAYSPSEFGSGGYTLRVTHNGAVLPVDAITAEGVPSQTRDEPGPYTRFTNLSVIFVEPQAGEWTVELVDPSGLAVGPPATFTLTADETTRELYVRYRSR